MTLLDLGELTKDIIIAVIILFILTAAFSYGDAAVEQEEQISEVGWLDDCGTPTVSGNGDFSIQSSEEKSPLTGYFY